MIGKKTMHVAVLSLAAAICSAAGWARADAKPSADIVDTAVSAGNFKTLVAAVQAAGLVETLKGRGPLTVFAPTDEAFSKLPKETIESLLKPESKDKLTAILTYHVLPGRVLAKDAYGLSAAATVNGQRVQIARDGARLTIDEANLLKTDIDCTNGVIHVIDRVLLPQQARIPAVAKEAGKFRTLLAAVTAAGLADTLAGDGPFTVFAPTDEAFAKLPPGTVKSLLKPENRDQLIAVLEYHVVSGRVYSDDAIGAEQAETLLGREVRISVAGDGVRINDASLVAADIDAANGVIHVIDKVLLPEPMSATAAARILRDAIHAGVPAYNHGDRHRCVQLYTQACERVVAADSGKIPSDVMAVLRLTLDRAKGIHHLGERAWSLRYGMDLAIHGLERKRIDRPVAMDK